jgi:hypothetical protein
MCLSPKGGGLNVDTKLLYKSINSRVTSNY